MRISDWSSDVCSSDLFVTLASGIDGDEDALPIRANARVAAASVNAGESVSYDLEAGRHAYLVAAKGRIRVNGEDADPRSEEHTSELQSLMRISYAVFCLKKKKNTSTRGQ